MVLNKARRSKVFSACSRSILYSLYSLMALSLMSGIPIIRQLNMSMIPEANEEQVDFVIRRKNFSMKPEAKEKKDDIVIPDAFQESWIGSTAEGDPYDLDITVIVTFCSRSLSWLKSFLSDFKVVNVAVFSKCGNVLNTDDLPDGVDITELPNLGGNEHTIAYFLSHFAFSMGQSGSTTRRKAYVFLKDNLNTHQKAYGRSLHEMLRITSKKGFGCFQEPSGGLSIWHQTDILKQFSLESYCDIGDLVVDKEGIEHCLNNITDFKSQYENMGAWLDDMGIDFPSPYSSVCYGGMYATLASHVAKVPVSVWEKLEKSLRRGASTEEMHFAERTWAALLTNPIEGEDIELIQRVTPRVNFLDSHWGSLIANQPYLFSRSTERNMYGMPVMSLVVLTFNKANLLEGLLGSIDEQHISFPIEVILVDNGCFQATKDVFDKFSSRQSGLKTYEYLPFCNNPGYAIANNNAVFPNKTRADWILFLSDDLVLHEGFIQFMYDMATSEHEPGAVGCKLLDYKGARLIEAGSMVWANGRPTGYGRAREDVNAFDVSYARPIDYVSGACLMIETKTFVEYGGFQYRVFPSYFEDTDLQMHLQHDLGKQVWLQPLAKANHAEHGTFGQSERVDLMKKGRTVFEQKWRKKLKRYHVPAPKGDNYRHLSLLFARDLRSRDKETANILYIDSALPNPAQGSGFGRAYDNLKMIAELGHFITVAPVKHSTEWCAEDFIKELQIDVGLEVFLPDEGDPNGSLDRLMTGRIGLYDVVLVSRPATLGSVYEVLQRMYKLSPFVLIYDMEALWYQRDLNMLSSAALLQGSAFPSMDYLNEKRIGATEQVTREAIGFVEDWESGLLRMADIIIAVSEREARQTEELLHSPSSEQGHILRVIGHIMMKEITNKDFSKRRGILFLGSFHNKMYYNGDALWYFLTRIYPLVLKASDVSIPLMIAGRGIPQAIRDTVKNDHLISQHVTFFDSPLKVTALYENCRLMIAPHLYGTGIQYKVSEALAVGLPVVMSRSTAENFGIDKSDEIACVGSTPEAFKDCVLEVYGNEGSWSRLRKNGMDFIRRTHDRKTFVRTWSEVIDAAMTIRSKLPRGAEYQHVWNLPFEEPKASCPHGEERYMALYPDVAQAVKDGIFSSAWEHYDLHGRADGRIYICGVSSGFAAMDITSLFPRKSELCALPKIYFDSIFAFPPSVGLLVTWQARFCSKPPRV